MEEPARFSGAGALAVVPSSSSSSSGAASAPAPPPVRRFVRQQVPDSILNNTQLNEAMAVLPANYNFEIHKTVWRIQQAGAKQVALQFPEGLLMYACTIADIMQEFAGVEQCYIMGDVTYGACCIDDFSAAALGADFLVHYGHSCLVPVDITSVPCLYVFVDIQIDVDHLIDSIQVNFKPGTDLVLAGTIQFSSAIQLVKQRLAATYPSLTITKCRPLSPGEVLGCTAPVLTHPGDALVFVADGRFHLEAIMIANPGLPAYRYDPYGRDLIREQYDQVGMRAARQAAIAAAAPARHWGVILGTLGRQGNPQLMATLQQKVATRGLQLTTVLLSEVTPPKLKLLGHVQAWVQVACPRLSIDWGEGFDRPTLTPYEALIALGEVPGWWERADSSSSSSSSGCGAVPQASSTAGACCPQPDAAAGAGGGCGTCGSRSTAAGGCKQQGAAVAPYPMDYYAKEGGAWNSSYHKLQQHRRPVVQSG